MIKACQFGSCCLAKLAIFYFESDFPGEVELDPKFLGIVRGQISDQVDMLPRLNMIDICYRPVHLRPTLAVIPRHADPM